MSQNSQCFTIKNKPKLWDGKDIKEHCLVTIKLDGVRMLRDKNGTIVSRANKPLNNLDHISNDILDAEVFLGNWEDTVSAVRSKKYFSIPEDCVFSLDPIDERLVVGNYTSLKKEEIDNLLELSLLAGNEGLVIYCKHKSFKVKNRETYDVRVIGATEGKGKYRGLIGALVTDKGNVSGFTDEQRHSFTESLPECIEVACMGLTPSGKFRHPRFVRERFDK